jgi:hypothetical protein
MRGAYADACASFLLVFFLPRKEKGELLDGEDIKIYFQI